MTIGHRHGEGVGQISGADTLPCGVVPGCRGRSVGEPAISGDHDGALGSANRSAVGQAVTVSIAGRHRTSDHPGRFIGVTHERRQRLRRRVGRADRHRNRHLHRTAMPIRHRHREGVGQIRSHCPIAGRIVPRSCGRGIGEPSIRVDHHTALSRGRRTTENQRITVRVAGTDRTDDHSCHDIRGAHHRNARHRGVIGRSDHNADQSSRGSAVPVSHGHREAIRAPSIGRVEASGGMPRSYGRCVGELPGGRINDDRPLGGARRGGVDENVPIGITGVDLTDNHAAGRIGGAYGRDFDNRRRIVRGCGKRADSHHDGHLDRPAITIGHRHGEGVDQICRHRFLAGRLMPSRCGRGVGEPAISVDHHAALGRGGRTTEGQRITVRVAGDHGSDDHARRLVRTTHRRGTRHRGAIGRTDHDADHRRRRAAIPVNNGHREGVRQIGRHRFLAGRLMPSRCGRGVGEPAISVDHHAALGRGGRTTEGQRITVRVAGDHGSDDHARRLVRTTHRRGTRHRGAIGRTDHDADHRRRRAAIPVSHGHREGVRQISTGRVEGGGAMAGSIRRGVGELPGCPINDYRPLGGARRRAVGQGVPVGVTGRHLARHHPGARIRSPDSRGLSERGAVGRNGHKDVDDRRHRLGDCLDDLVDHLGDRGNDSGDEGLNLLDECGDRVDRRSCGDRVDGLYRPRGCGRSSDGRSRGGPTRSHFGVD